MFPGLMWWERGKQTIVLRCRSLNQQLQDCCLSLSWRIYGPAVHVLFSTLMGQIQSIERNRKEYFRCFCVACWMDVQQKREGGGTSLQEDRRNVFTLKKKCVRFVAESYSMRQHLAVVN